MGIPTPSSNDLLNNKKAGQSIESNKFKRKYPEIPQGQGELDLYKDRKLFHNQLNEIVQCKGKIWSNCLIEEVKVEMSNGRITESIIYTD